MQWHMKDFPSLLLLLLLSRYDLIDLDRGGMPDWDCLDTSGHVTGNACFASGWWG